MRKNNIHKISALGLVLYLIICIVLSSCHKSHQYPRELIYADSLLLSNVPDKAVVYLQRIKKYTMSMNAEDLWYYRLLCLKANDKAYIPNKDTCEAERIVTYYKGQSNDSLLAISLYYAGSVYRDTNSYKKSLSYYYEVISLLENDIANPYYGLANSQIGQICLYHGLYDKAKSCFLNSLQTDILNKKPKDIMFDYRDIADSYRSMCQYDSALYYYDKAYNLTKNNKDSVMEAIIDTQRAALFRRQKRYNMALRAIEKAIKLSPRNNLSAALSVAADIYMDVNETEKALSCYNRLMKEGNVYAKYDACKNLSTYYRAKGEDNVSTYYLKYSRILRDSIEKSENVEDIAEVLKSRSNKIIEDEKNQQILCAIAFIFLIVFGGVFCLVKKINYAKITDDDFYSSDIYDRITTFLSTERDWKMSDDDWVELDSELNKYFHGFKSGLYRDGKMNAHRYRLCMLIKCKISSKDISEILFCSKQAVTNLRSTMSKEKFGKDAKPSDWDEYIYSL